MPKIKAKKELDTSTESKIKEAARLVFYKKGFAATRTRDIAEEAGINLALLNYYFRSKQKLFDIIMLESLLLFLESLTKTVNNESTSLESKLECICAGYIDMLLVEPQIPLFILSELRNNPKDLFKKMNAKQIIMKSVLAKQFQERVDKGKIKQPNMLHFLMNLLGLTVFPFIASPLLKMMGDLKDEQFDNIMLDRKKLIPIWMKTIM